MEEILAMQAQLAAMQMEETKHKLVERNCIEILLKLKSTEAIDIIYTKSGKEYVTPQQLRKEMEQLIVERGGRVTMVEMGPELDVDTSNIQTTLSDLLGSSQALSKVSGEIISKEYLDGVVEEINKTLEDVGQLSVVDVATRFSLPAAFMKAALDARAGSLLEGQLKGNEIFTEAFVDRHKARVRGAFAGLTRPTPLRIMVTQHSLLENLAYTQLKAWVDGGVLPGKLKGSEARSIYTPDIFSQGQSAAVEAFFTQNGYIEYSALKKLEIANGKAFLKDKYPKGIGLQSLWLSQTNVESLAASLEEAFSTCGYLLATGLLPSPLSRDDVGLVLDRCLVPLKSQARRLGDDLAVSNEFVDKCRELLEPAVTAAAKACAAEKKSAVGKSAQDQEEVRAPRGAADSDEDEAPREAPRPKKGGKKGGRKGKEEPEEEGGLSKKALRQAKAKAGKGNGRGNIRASKEKAGKVESDEEEEARPKKGGKKGGGGGKSKGKAREERLKMPARLVLDGLRSGFKGERCPDQVLRAVADLLDPELQTRFASAVAVLLSGDSGAKRKAHDAAVAKLQDLFHHMHIFTDALEGFMGDADDDADRPAWQNSAGQAMQKHLLRTLGAQAVDVLLRDEASHQGFRLEDQKAAGASSPPVPAGGGATTPVLTSFAADTLQQEAGAQSSSLEPKTREDILAVIPVDHSRAIRPLLHKKVSSEFLVSLEEVTGDLEIMLKKLDKKRERNLIFNIRRGLMAQLQQESRPMLVLHYTALILQSKISGLVLHAPNRIIGSVVQWLGGKVTRECFSTMVEYDALVRMYLQKRDGGDDEDDDDDDDDDEGDDADHELSGLSLEQIKERLSAGLEVIRSFGLNPKDVCACSGKDE